MKREYIKQHSEALGEDISMIVYGEAGYPVVAFQTQNSKSNNLEDFGMVDEIADFIDGGQIQLFSVDNVDEESWSDVHGEKNHRAERQEAYFRFVTDELIPQVHQINGSNLRPLAIGCSMGATHAAIAALRRPDLFQGCIALSGVYRSSFFFGDWMNSTLYNNDVTAFLPNMSKEHPYVDLYNHRSLVFCVGQGAWEDGLGDTHFIDEQLRRLGVSHWCDFWGTDVNHDWPWWKKQIRYFLPYVLDDMRKEVALEQAAKAEPKVSEEPAKVEEPAAEAEVETKPAEAAKPEEPAKAEAKPEPAKPAEEPKPAAKKPAAKRATTRRTTPKKAAAPKATATKADEAKAEAVKAEEPAKAAPKKAAAKTAAKKPAAAKKATTAAKATATKAAAAKAEEPKAEAAAKPAAKKTTTRRATAKKATTTAKATKATTAKKAATKTAAKKAPATKKAAAPKADKAE